MKATELLKRQRRWVRALLSKLELGERDALRELSRLLIAQLKVERELFFPAVMHLAQTEVLEAWDNHSTALKALSQALAARHQSGTFGSRVGTLKSIVLNLHETEESALFAVVDHKVPAERLETLGSEMEARFFTQLKRLWERDYLGQGRKRRTTDLTRIACGSRVPRRARALTRAEDNRSHQTT